MRLFFSGKSFCLCSSCSQKRKLLLAEQLIEKVLLDQPYVNLCLRFRKPCGCFLPGQTVLRAGVPAHLQSGA